MDTVHHYEVRVDWAEATKGLMSSPVLQSSIEVATPPEFPRGIPGVWSPEHLLVAAVNSCLMTTFLAVAENSKFTFVNFESKADGKLERVDGKFMISEIVLSPVLTISKNTDPERALRILHKAEAACLVSNSVKSTILFLPVLRVAE